MNIVLVSHCNFLGQSAYHVHSIAKELALRGCACILCVPSGAEQAAQQVTPMVPIINYNTVLEQDKLDFPDGCGPALIHCWTPREHVRQFTSELVMRYGCPYVVHLEDNEPEILIRELKSLGYDAIEQLAPDVQNSVISPHLINPGLYRQFLENAAGCTTLIDRLLEHVPDGVPGLVFWPGYDDIFSPETSIPDSQTRRKYGVADSDFVIFYSGAFHVCNEDEVGQMLLALELLHRQGVPLKLLKTGRNLLPATLNNQLPGSYMIDLGFVPRVQLPELLSIADVIIQPGKSDEFNNYRFPSKLPEALISGKPVILPKSNLGRFLVDGVNALVTETGSVEELAAKIRDLYENPELRRTIGSNGQAFALAHLQWGTAANKILAFYKEQCLSDRISASVTKDLLAEYNMLSAERSKEIEKLKYAVMERDGQITSLSRTSANLEQQLHEVQNSVADMNKQVAALSHSIAERDGRIECSAQTLAEQDAQIAVLNQAIAERDRVMESLLNSKSWRLTKPLRYLRAGLPKLSCDIPRSLISGSARCLWRHMPVSPRGKQLIKNTLFNALPFLFKRTLAYSQWLNHGVPSPEESSSSCMQIRDVDSPAVLNPPLSDNPLNNSIEGAFGINVVGSITSESGVGEAVRADIRSIDKAGIPRVLYNVISNSSEADNSYSDFTEDNPYMINLIHLNADSLPVLWNRRGSDFLRGRYNIGYWFWELSEFPHVWNDRFKWFDEIWVATDFCLDAIARVSPVPVVKMQLPIVADSSFGFDRTRYGLKEESFVFFFMFDFLSYFERKNPLAVIEAFRSAFGPRDDVELLIKCSNSDWNKESRAKLETSCRGMKIRFMDKRMSRSELNNLISLTDCYVSLHRSEGFGLPLAEAMYLGKPVIATAYSGNLEFMNINNSFLVKYRLVEIERDFGPYKKGRVWADPDIGHAAELMRMVFDNRDIAVRTGEKAASDMRTYLSPEICGKLLLDRVRHISRHSMHNINRGHISD